MVARYVSWQKIVRMLVVVGLLSASASLAQSPDLLSSAGGRETVFQALVDIFKENYWDASYTDWDAWAEKYREAAVNASSRRSFDGIARRMVFELEDEHSSWVGRVVYVDDTSSLPQTGRSSGVGLST